MMLCYWGDEGEGEEVRPGFGLVEADRVQRSQSGVFFCSPEERIRQLAPGRRRLVGFIRGEGAVSVLRLPRAGGACGKLNSLELEDKIMVMRCGETQALLLTDGGTIFWMDQSDICRPIDELSGRNVIQVACGNQHCMALTDDGQLFTWGENSSGQLGLGKGKPNTPQPLKSLFGIPLAQISAGGDHSFALSLSGAVFGWGRNNAGQLGLGDAEDRYTPACVNNLSFKKTVFIACGEDHTATLSKGGTVFTFGSGRYGQLGHNSFRDELRPRVVAALWGSKVSHITCGRHHTLALVNSANTVYSFGCGEQGQLGNGLQTNQSVPLPVQLPPEANHNQIIEQIAAGANHSFVLCSQQENDPEVIQERGIFLLEHRLIERWIQLCDIKWRTIKKEIKQVFSSAACLNGSFIKKSCDGHYQTSANFSGLDMESVRAAAERLAKKDKVLLQVEKIVENNLFPSLGLAFDVEALRVYLILPELLKVMNKPEQETKLTGELASAILRLNPFMLQVLKNYWSDLPDKFLKTLVELLRKQAANIISQKTFYPQADITDDLLKKFVQVLQLIYEATCSNQRDITSRDFFIHEINVVFETLATVHLISPFWFPNFEVSRNVQYLAFILHTLKSSPCIFNLETKCKLLEIRFVQSCFSLVLRRTALVEDCFSQLKATESFALKGLLQVVYSEKDEKTDVNKRDFFHNVFKELLKTESGMFMYNDSRTLIWFPSEPSLPEERYFLFGCLCGVAFYNNSVVNLPFPLALFKKLLNIQPSLEDLTEFSPVLGKSLQSVLDYSDEDLQSSEMPSTIVWDNKAIELDPYEPEKVITSSNKKKFVDAYVDYAMNRSVERVFEEFSNGFYKVCDRDMVELFLADELRGVMVGSEEYDWDVLKQDVTYEGLFHAKHPTIISFWKVFDELSDKDKKTFLLFLTGFDRVPVLGMNQVKMKVCPLINSTQDHLPEALTCHSILQLPEYKTKKRLKAKFIEALQHKRGFWNE